jgi:hypothetical protein
MTQYNPAGQPPAPDPQPPTPPYLTDSIKLQSIDRLQSALRYIRRSLPDPTKNDQTITQSNGALSTPDPWPRAASAFVPILDALRDRQDRTGLWSPNAFPALEAQSATRGGARPSP